MKRIEYIRWADPPVWKATLVGLLPLWLFSLAFIVPKLAGIAFWLAIAAIVLLLWLRWFTAELTLYSFFPILPAIFFEEVPASYKVPFFLLCTLILTIGILGYWLSLYKGSVGFGWLLLLVSFISTWFLAARANENYWQMVNVTPWWILFFSS